MAWRSVITGSWEGTGAGWADTDGAIRTTTADTSHFIVRRPGQHAVCHGQPAMIAFTNRHDPEDFRIDQENFRTPEKALASFQSHGRGAPLA
jgi:hypothetical protein